MKCLVLFLLVSDLVSAWRVGPLLSSCIDACQRGCDQIRAVQALREASSDSDPSNNEVLQIAMKDASDSRSALTIADQAAQRAIVDALRQQWGDELRIVGEEDEEDLRNSEGSRKDGLVTEPFTSPLKTDILDDDLGDETPDWDPADICIFVDPLDGTREFVEGRLENCQVLVGIAYRGEAVAGAIGIPFPTGSLQTSTESTIVYGLAEVGTGFRGAALTRGPFPLDKYIDGIKFPRPQHATGDRAAAVIEGASRAIVRVFGGSRVTYGGAGNKILAAALGEVACSFQHIVGGPWDLCAPQAIAKAMGAEMTDFFGGEIKEIYRDDANPRCNERGYLVSSPGSDHASLVQALQKVPEVQEYKRSVYADKSEKVAQE